jgi:hypothetical protein
MKYAVIAILMSLFSAVCTAQPIYLKQLQERYKIQNGFKSTVNIQIDVPGIIAPTKTIEIYAENGKAPKIKGDGIILLPKKGFVLQFSELLTIPVHWIYIDSKGDFDYYKLVSLDPKSDWVTTDIKIKVSEYRIEELNLATRDAGGFLISHKYEKGNYPVQSEISFETDRFNIPLKFMGKSDFSEVKDSNGKVSGKIILDFEDFEVF